MIIDIIVAIVLVISAGISFLRGFIRELFTIAGVVGGVVAAIFFSPPLAKVFRNWFGANEGGVEGEEVAKLFDLIPMHYVADACAYGAIFIAFVIIISVLAQFFSAAVKAAGLGPIDRTFGVVFGLLRAVLLLALLYLPFHLLMDQNSKSEYFADSKTHTYIEKVSGFIAGFLPSSKDVEDKVKEVQNTNIKDKLFENDILFNKDKKRPAVAAPSEEKQNESTENQPTGYDEEQRQEIKNLFREPTFNQ